MQFQPFSVSDIHNRTEYKDFNELHVSGQNSTIAILGDLQRTSLWELMMGREQNDNERERIIAEIRKEDPSLLILLGDLVYDGGSRDQWIYFDNLMEPLKDYPVLTVLGNHEYYSSGHGTTSPFITERFKLFDSATWYTRRYGNLGFIFLNSNEQDLPSNEWNKQLEWFNKVLEDYESDSSIKGIMVFTHHPPYTNSLLTGDEKHIQRAFIPAFMKAKKTIAFFSGHAHTYENFSKDGKHFIVSGGGGGPRVFLNKGKDRHDDACSHKGVRPFHYLLLTQNENNVELVVKGINKGESEFSILDSFEMKLKK
jgi:Icc-related predicted phosphoesterase